MLVNFRGDVEHFASEVFQPRVGAWFNSEVANQARTLVLQHGLEQNIQEGHIHEADDADDAQASPEVADELEDDIMQEMRPGVPWDQDDQESVHDGGQYSMRQADNSYAVQSYEPGAAIRSRLAAPELRRTWSMPTTLPQQPGAHISHNTPTLKSFHRPAPLDMSLVHEDRPLASTTPRTATGDFKALTIGNESEITAFLETRFRQLQQLVCKIVAKAWIKVIEPKKQTRYPYNKGEESKPKWWPENVRHKEPDHLMKPERINLLMTMLRCGKVLVNRLELATAEVAAFIPSDKINLLREIYKVAREEELFRADEIGSLSQYHIDSD